MTTILMLVLLFFLGFILVFGSKYNPSGDHLFDKKNSNAMRGFWSLIVMLVHVPELYQNRIQDMLGSFAYIGVTFFFMTSAYGLKLNQKKDPDSIKTFWGKRLTRLFIPMFLVNLVSTFMKLAEGKQFTIWMILSINAWVFWLLVCYFLFWIVYRIPFSHFQMGGGTEKYKDSIVCILIVVCSVTSYFFKKAINYPTWCPELFGFVWGIIFSNVKSDFLKWTQRGWILKSIITCFASMLLGIAYLKFKPVYFWGDYLLKIILGFSILLFLLMLNSRIMIGNAISFFLGKVSFEVYLLHFSVYAFIAYLASEIESGIFITVSMSITVLIGFGLNVIGNCLSKIIVKKDKNLSHR